MIYNRKKLHPSEKKTVLIYYYLFLKLLPEMHLTEPALREKSIMLTNFFHSGGE